MAQDAKSVLSYFHGSEARYSALGPKYLSPPAPAMASEEQLKAILDQNAQFLTAMAKHHEQAMQTLIETVMKAQLKDR